MPTACKPLKEERSELIPMIRLKSQSRREVSLQVFVFLTSLPSKCCLCPKKGCFPETHPTQTLPDQKMCKSQPQRHQCLHSTLSLQTGMSYQHCQKYATWIAQAVNGTGLNLLSSQLCSQFCSWGVFALFAWEAPIKQAAAWFQVNFQGVSKHSPRLGKSEPSNLRLTERADRVPSKGKPCLASSLSERSHLQ